MAVTRLARRTRTGIALLPRAPWRTCAAALALLLAGSAAPATAQYDPEPGEVVLDEAEADPSFETGPVEGAVSLTDERGWSSTASLYAEPPDPARCVAGVLSPQTKLHFLEAFNALRARHGLAPVRYNEAADPAVADAALMMATNNALSHEPPPTWSCWTAAGARAAASSNLLGGVSSPYLTYEDNDGILAEWLIEGDGDEIGHRRWMLDPYLEQTSLGRVIAILGGGVRVDSTVMKVFDFSGALARPAIRRSVPDYVAWPQGAYPARFFSPNARLSFSISQPSDALTQVDFSEARVAISDGERSLPVRDQLRDNEGFGVANCLSWRVDGIVPGRSYAVTISGIHGAPQKQYQYSFRITA